MLPIKIKAVVVAAFEPDSGAVPGEMHHFRIREKLSETLSFAAGYLPLCLSAAGVLGVVTGVGTARAAASMMALGLDERFDLRSATILITGVCGVSPGRGSLASVVMPEYVVDGNLTHEIDAREIPADDLAWPDGFVPIGKSVPYEQPLAQRFNGDDGIVFRLDRTFVAEAYALVRDTELLDTPQVAARRADFEPAATAHCPPRVLRGDELSSSTFWHGKLLAERAARWVTYQTEGRGTYSITAMEDAGILQALSFLAGAGRVDFGRVVIARGVSNFDQQRPGVTAAASLAESRVASYSAYLPALENAYRVGARLVKRAVAEFG